MCVILVADDTRPSKEMIEKAWRTNKHGGGMAWREPARDGNGMEVVFSKSLKLEDMVKMAEELPLPYVMHFRIASVGGERPELTHPFPIDERGRNPLEGRTKGSVLFHNGHWSDWKRFMLEAAARYGKKIPAGKYSDTRAMAWLASFMGHGLMDLIEEKGVAFGPTDVETFWGSGWYVIDNVWASNEGFIRAHNNAYNWQRTNNDPTGAYGTGAGVHGNVRTGLCIERTCTNRGTLTDSGHCPLHAHLGHQSRQNPSSEPVQRPAVGGTQQGTQTGSSTQQTPVSGKKTEPNGGAQTPPSPFIKFLSAIRQHQEGKLSNRKLKGARRLYEQTLRQMGREVPPVIIKGQSVTVGTIH